MGYILIDENEFERRVALWHNPNYMSMAVMDVHSSKVDFSHLLEELLQAEAEISEKINELENQRNNLNLLMKYAKSKF